MKQLNGIKLKLEKINSIIAGMQKDGVSLIEKDILLSELRSIYSDVAELNFDKEASNDLEDNHSESINPNNQPVQKVIDEEVINTATLKNEPQLDLETNSESNSENQETENNSESEEPIETPDVKMQVPKRDLFNGSANGTDKKVIGEELGKHKKSLNESFSNNSSDISSKVRLSPLTDIKSGIGLGDRFLYIRELFNGDNELFENTIKKLNGYTSMEEAVNYLDSNFNWKAEDVTVGTFLNVVKRRYL